MIIGPDFDTNTWPDRPLNKDESFSAEYFITIAQFVNMCEEIIPNRKELLESLKNLHTRAWKEPRNKFELLIQKIIAPKLEKYAPNVNAPLAQLPLLRIWNNNLRKVMRTYHLIMLEIELMNRMNKESFQKAHGKIAILPLCLRFQVLKSEMKCCNSDSGKSFVHHASNFFLDFGIDAYLWMSSSLKSVFRLLDSNREHFGVIGMASIPELYSSMQKCMKLGVPVLGVPLATNPCQRWMINTDENTVYFQEVKKLLAI